MKFQETKPRKAKHGFKVSVDNSTIMLLGKAIESVFAGVPEGSDRWWWEFTNKFGRAEVLVYINDEELYQNFKAVHDVN